MLPFLIVLSLSDKLGDRAEKTAVSVPPGTLPPGLNCYCMCNVDEWTAVGTADALKVDMDTV